MLANVELMKCSLDQVRGTVQLFIEPERSCEVNKAKRAYDEDVAIYGDGMKSQFSKTEVKERRVVSIDAWRPMKQTEFLPDTARCSARPMPQLQRDRYSRVEAWPRWCPNALQCVWVALRQTRPEASARGEVEETEAWGLKLDRKGLCLNPLATIQIPPFLGAFIS